MKKERLNILVDIYFNFIEIDTILDCMIKDLELNIQLPQGEEVI